MQEEEKTEIVEEVAKDSALDLARKALRRDIRVKKISKICSIMIPVLIGIMIICIPILTHNVNVSKNDRYWKSMISSTEINYNDLVKEDSETIEEINDKNKGAFYWMGNAEVTETYVLKQEDKIVVIEEHYLYEGIECVLYIVNTNSIIEGIIDDNIFFDYSIFIDNIYTISYTFLDDACYSRYTNIYNYQFIITSTDTSTIETILSNLRNN